MQIFFCIKTFSHPINYLCYLFNTYIMKKYNLHYRLCIDILNINCPPFYFNPKNCSDMDNYVKYALNLITGSSFGVIPNIDKFKRNINFTKTWNDFLNKNCIFTHKKIYSKKWKKDIFPLCTIYDNVDNYYVWLERL
jgi:hypothetical protein